MTAEEQAAADKAKAEAEEREKAEAASAAAAELAKRKAEAEAARKAAAETPLRMVDLHDLRTELRGELDKVRSVRHAVPPSPPSPAQKRGGGVFGGVLGGVLVLLVVFGLAVIASREERRR